MSQERKTFTKRHLWAFQLDPKSLQKEASESEEHYFYEVIFSNIDESRFSVLYSDNASRPNSAVNCMVASLIFQYRKTWTYTELFNNLRFNILTRLALGLDDLKACLSVRQHYLTFKSVCLFIN